MHKALCEYSICNFNELLIYDMNETKGLGKVFKKIIISLLYQNY